MLIEYDARQEKCPLPLVTVKRYLRDLTSADSLRVLLSDSGSKDDIPKLLTMKRYQFVRNQLANSVVELIITGR